MPLTGLQKVIIDTTIRYGIEDLEEYEYKSKVLRAFQLILKETSLSASEGAALSRWLIDEKELDKQKQSSILDSVDIVRSIITSNTPEEDLNLIRNDSESLGHYPEVTAIEVKDYIKEIVNGHIQELEAQGIKPAKIPNITTAQATKIYLERLKSRIQYLAPDNKTQAVQKP